MNLIVAVSENWGIGFENKLLFRLPTDLQRFKGLTTGKVVVMGHNTLKSLRRARPLPNRVNIVLSKNSTLNISGAITCDSAEKLRVLLKNYKEEDIFIIGGETIYTRFLAQCAKAYVTKVKASPPADAFFPNIDAMANWRLVDESEEMFENGLWFRYCLYERCVYTAQIASISMSAPFGRAAT